MKTSTMAKSATTTALPVTIITPNKTYHFPAEIAGDSYAYYRAIRSILKEDPHAFDCLDEVSSPSRVCPIERTMILYNVNRNSALSREQTTIDYRNQPNNLNEPKVIDDFYERHNAGAVLFSALF